MKRKRGNAREKKGYTRKKMRKCREIGIPSFSSPNTLLPLKNKNYKSDKRGREKEGERKGKRKEK
jgi:hypothetical protein